MTPAKEVAVKAAAQRLSDARMRLHQTSMAPFGAEGAEVAYRLAQAEFNEAIAEVDRVTSANFQPE